MRTITIKDFETIQAVLKGDRESFADLVRAYHPQVLRVCMSILFNRTEAEDAAQDVFVKAYGALHQYKRDVSFPAWLCRIASNQCMDLLRKKTRHKTDSLDALVEQQGEQSPSFLTEDMPSREEDYPFAEKIEWAMQALSSLSEDYRQILILRELQGLNYDEIGVLLKCSLDAVKGRLKRARLDLQEQARHFLPISAFKP